MSETLVRDVLLRALASLRERNLLPSVDLPVITLVPLPDATGYTTAVAVDLAQAAEAADLEPITAATAAARIARYLDETVQLVPAYSEITRVVADSEGALLIYLR